MHRLARAVVAIGLGLGLGVAAVPAHADQLSVAPASPSPVRPIASTPSTRSGTAPPSGTPSSNAASNSGAPITGVPRPCKAGHAWPDAAPGDVVGLLQRNTGIALVGEEWTDPRYRPMVRIVWETLEGLSCTNYLRRVTMMHPGFALNAAPIGGYAWGDWGLTRSGAVTLDFGKWQQALDAGDPGRLVRILVHELGHAWATDRDGSSYWDQYLRIDAGLGPISAYGAKAVTENFSEIIGYYVARCARNNPYDTGRFAGYYDFVRAQVFGGREFGPKPGAPVNCSTTGTAPTVAPTVRLLTPASSSTDAVQPDSFDQNSTGGGAVSAERVEESLLHKLAG